MADGKKIVILYIVYYLLHRKYYYVRIVTSLDDSGCCSTLREEVHPAQHNGSKVCFFFPSFCRVMHACSLTIDIMVVKKRKCVFVRTEKYKHNNYNVHLDLSLIHI